MAGPQNHNKHGCNKKKIYFPTACYQVKTQRPAYAMLGHLLIHCRDQHRGMEKGNG